MESRKSCPVRRLPFYDLVLQNRGKMAHLVPSWVRHWDQLKLPLLNKLCAVELTQNSDCNFTETNLGMTTSGRQFVYFFSLRMLDNYVYPPKFLARIILKSYYCWEQWRHSFFSFSSSWWCCVSVSCEREVSEAILLTVTGAHSLEKTKINLYDYHKEKCTTFWAVSCII